MVDAMVDALGAWGLIAIGFALLALGGELIVQGGAATANRLGVSPVLIGVVLLGFGTSAPELFTSVQAVLDDAPGLAIGNVVGSNIANILLIAGVAAALTGAAATKDLLRRDGIALAIATILLCVVLWFDAFSPIVGLGFLAALAVFLTISVRSARDGAEIEEPDPETFTLTTAIILFILGVGATIIGAGWLVDGAVILAEEAGLSQALIGATIVAIGTSLPELAATIAASLRNRSDLAIGNVFGSNIFNIFGIAGAAALFGPMPVPPEILTVDVWIMAAATVALLWFAHSRDHISRVEGALLLCGYAIFLGGAIWSAQTTGTL